MHDGSCIGINYAHRFPKCCRSLHTLLGFSLCTSCHQFNCCRCTYLFNFWPVREFLVEIHTAKMVLWGVVFAPTVGCSRPPSAVNDPSATNKRKKNVKVARLRFYPKTANNGSPRSIMSLCMYAQLWTFFELLWAPPRIAPLPPSAGGRTRWWVPSLVFPEWNWPELSFSRFLVNRWNLSARPCPSGYRLLQFDHVRVEIHEIWDLSRNDRESLQHSSWCISFSKLDVSSANNGSPRFIMIGFGFGWVGW